MKVKRKYIWISLISLIVLIVIFLVPNTTWFQHYRQTRFINQVVKQTAAQKSYDIELTLNYQLLGYDMKLEGNGKIQSNTAHFNHHVALNGKGVSPMTLDLDQYVVKNEDTSIMYMSLNNGQWFKETAQEFSTMHHQFLNFNDLTPLDMNQAQILENSSDTQVIEVQTDLLNSDQLFQLLIQNIFTISNNMDITTLFAQAPAANYKLTIDKNNKLVSHYEINYKEGFDDILKQLQANYPTQFPSQVMQNYEEMFITLTVKLMPSDETEKISLSGDIETESVEIGTIK